LIVTHFDPYSAMDSEAGAPDIAPCGTRAAENYEATGNWKHVTCRRCLRSKVRLQADFDRSEELICKQMGDQANFEQGMVLIRADALEASERTQKLHTDRYFVSVNTDTGYGPESIATVPIRWETIKKILAAVKKDALRTPKDRSIKKKPTRRAR
jgi:hypothetical protein